MPRSPSFSGLARRVGTLLCLLFWACLTTTCQSAPAAIEPHAAPGRPKPKPELRRAHEPTRIEPVTVTRSTHPLAQIAPPELARIVQESPGELGSVSIGRPNRGGLYNGVVMTEGPHWEVRDPDRSWATRETVESLSRAIQTVAQKYPGTPRLVIGDISRKKGGYFRPHRSHQSGRDADIGYYYKVNEGGWYVKANEQNLDVERTWELLKALVSPGNVEYIFIDRSVQSLLRRHAEKVEPTTEWLDEVFENPAKTDETVIRHTWGHRTHMHVRFYGERACESSRLAYKLLARHGKI